MAELNLYTYATISMPGVERVQVGSKSTPLTVTLSASAPDFFHDVQYLATNDQVTLATFGAGYDMAAFKVAIFKPSVAMYVGWRSTNSTADNSVVEVAAGSLFVLTSDATTEYNATAGTRVDTATARDISELYAGNRGSAGKIELWVVN